MTFTRRKLARMLATAAAAPASAAAQAPPQAEADLKAARDRMANEASQLAKVALPMTVEPACRFKA